MDKLARELGATEECPLFEIVRLNAGGIYADDYFTANNGEIVEGCGFDYDQIRTWHPASQSRFFYLDANNARPLTSAARDMLSLVRP